MKKKNINTYSVKIKISIPGYKNVFFSGISIHEGPQKASDQAIDLLIKDIKSKSPEAPVLDRRMLSVVKVEKIKTDFVANCNDFVLLR